MADVRPFRGLRFNPLRVGSLADVVCPPYDVIAPAQQAQYYLRSPYNLIRVELGRDESGDDDLHNRYSRAAATLEDWRRERALVPDPAPSIYLHRARFALDGRQYERRDLVAAVCLEPWERGVVLPHERTMRAPKEDRLRLLRATHTQVSPVWMLYRGESEALGQAWQLAEARSPQSTLQDDDGVEHALWVVSDRALIAPMRADFEERILYIADGHHRYETALAYQQQRRDSGQGGADSILTVLTSADDSGLSILPIHRLVAGLPNDHQQALKELMPAASEEALEADAEQAAAHVARLGADIAGSAEHDFAAIPAPGRHALRFGLEPAPASWQPERSDAWRDLDVTLLHAQVVDPLLERYGLRPEEALEFTHDAREALSAVRGGTADLGLLVAPTRVEQVLAVADAGDRMPQKSTFFVPKTPTGLVLLDLDDSSTTLS